MDGNYRDDEVDENNIPPSLAGLYASLTAAEGEVAATSGDAHTDAAAATTTGNNMPRPESSPEAQSLSEEKKLKRRLIRPATLYVQRQMSGAGSKFDSSHDFNHILRVIALSLRILAAEQARRRGGQVSQEDGSGVAAAAMAANPDLDEDVVILGACMHDIEDKKYRNESALGLKKVAELLLEWGADDELGKKIQLLCDGVSYSSEIANPAAVLQLIAQIPELAIVQDADRIDALGAVGVGRCFTFGGARGHRMDGSGGTMPHFASKLVKLQGMMKTEAGKALAAERTKRVLAFTEWWEEETGTRVV